MNLSLSGGLLVLSTSIAMGQSTASPAFEVASVKVSAPLPHGVMAFRMGDAPDSADPGRIAYSGVSLKALVARAYNVKEYQVEGPQWLDGDRYDVMATIPQGSNREQVNLMMQNLLAERFKLTLHHESKPLAVYTVSVAKGGPKLKEVDPAVLAAAPPPPPPGAPPPPPHKLGSPVGPAPAGATRILLGTNFRWISGSSTLARLCSSLSNLLDRPVIDLTELKGTYEIDLHWTPDESELAGGKLAMGMASMRAAAGAPPPTAAGGDGRGAPEAAGEPGLTLAQALQVNYGLKLEPKKNPADILVVDRAEKVPTEN